MTKSRRDFLKAAGLTLGCVTTAGSLGSVIASGSPELLPREYTNEQIALYPQLSEVVEEPPHDQIENLLASNTGNDTITDLEGGDTWLAELWADEAVHQLNKHMGFGISGQIARDCNENIRAYGDVVNVRSVSDFNLIRNEGSWDNDPSVGVVQKYIIQHHVPLDERLYASFIIKDGEAAKDLPELVDIHLVPAMRAMAHALNMRTTDRLLRDEVRTFKSARPRNSIFRACAQLNIDKCTLENRMASVPPEWECDLYRDGMHDNKEFCGFKVGVNILTQDGFAFHRDNVVLVNRPTMCPSSTLGIKSHVSSHHDLALRAIMQYDMAEAGTLIRFDLLNHVTVINPQHVLKLKANA